MNGMMNQMNPLMNQMMPNQFGGFPSNNQYPRLGMNGHGINQGYQKNQGIVLPF